MNISLILLLLGLAGLVVFGWRLASRRHTLPCPVWMGRLVELDNPFSKINKASVIVDHLGLRPGMTVLDAGCGPGRVTIPLAEQVGEEGEVVAADIQPGMLDHVRAKAESAGLGNVTCLQAGLGEGRLGYGRFDRALLVTVLGEIPDRHAAMGELFGALKEGGLLAVTEVIFDPHFLRRRTVLRLAEDTGFRWKAVHGNAIDYMMLLEKPVHSDGRR